MRKEVRVIVKADPRDVFASLHHYKKVQSGKEFFPTKLIKVDFRVLTDNPVGLGAEYAGSFQSLVLL